MSAQPIGHVARVELKIDDIDAEALIAIQNVLRQSRCSAYELTVHASTEATVRLGTLQPDLAKVSAPGEPCLVENVEVKR